MLTVAQTGRQLREFCRELSEQELLDADQGSHLKPQASPPRLSIQDWILKPFAGMFATCPRDYKVAIGAFHAHTERACQASASFLANCRSNWPSKEYLQKCEEMSQWLEGIFLPLQGQNGWFWLARSASFSQDVLQVAQQQLPLLCAVAACEVRSAVRLPFQALLNLAQSVPLKPLEVAGLVRWKSDLHHYRGIVDPIFVHLAVKYFALSTRDLNSPFPPKIAEAIAWGQLECTLRNEHHLEILSPHTALFAGAFKSSRKRQLSIGYLSKSFDTRFDYLQGDPLGENLSLYRSKSKVNSALLIAREGPFALLELLGNLPKLSQLASPPTVLEIDPLGQFCILQVSPDDLAPIQSADLPPDQSADLRLNQSFAPPGKPAASPVLAPAEESAITGFFSHLRRQGISPATDLRIFSSDKEGRVRWLFPVSFTHFNFKRVLGLMRSKVSEGPQLARMAQLSGLSECREAQECSWVLRCALDNQPIDLRERNLPLSWPKSFLSDIERLHYIGREGKARFVQALSQSSPGVCGPSEQIRHQTAIQQFDYMVLTAHAEAGYGTYLRAPSAARACTRSEPQDANAWLDHLSGRLLLAAPLSPRLDTGDATHHMFSPV